MDTQEKPKAKSRAKKPKEYYIVNPAGAVHCVTREHAKMRLAQVGFRLAKPDEIKAYKSQRVQRHKTPIAKPWTPEPDEAVELD